MAHIDNHIIHGQDATRWCEALDANLIIVVNDELASNKMRQVLLDRAVPDK
ncbi:PTS sugar transporter subunit IIB [Fundicoccus sp. Sow4_D5]|uniref:PTS sugar transporter subunit IIB n=1 Tax=unclassified Fundicoccus TaxID=2761543 RepID=UPI003F8F291D